MRRTGNPPPRNHESALDQRRHVTGLPGALLAGPTRARPVGQTVTGLLEDSFRSFPERTAVIHPGGALTYRDLDALTGAVAADLRAAGAGPGALVPLLLDDRLTLLVAMIGAMRAGAAFVPFDLSWPARRQFRLLDELAPTVVIGQPPWPLSGVPAVPVTTDPSAHPAAPEPPRVALSDSDLIYGFYTSGSTGLPKCAMNVHRGLVNRFLSMTERFADDGAVVLQNSAHTFDSSIWQFIWPLTRGARTVIPDRANILDLDATIAQIHRHGVTMTDFVPSIFDILVERLRNRPQDRRSLSSLRQVFIGGETANPRTVRDFRRMLPGVRVTNTYGPTEASIGSVFHAVCDDDRDVIPLGRPLPNTFVLLLDADGRPTPPGEVGEIYLGGLCVGVGYHGDPARTRAAFVPNPFADVPGDTLYRTGDFGWLREDGLLMFGGRRDAQVKIGGVRIDLGEVESVVSSCPGVRQVKLVVSDAGAAPVLACFYSADAAVRPDDLREHALATLPAAFVPTVFVRLDSLPLLPNGKVDQVHLRRLLATGAGRAAKSDPASPFPSGSVPAKIAAVWTRVLGHAPTDTDLFGAGGTSLAAARIAVELDRIFGVRVTPRDILEHPTIEAQAKLVQGGQTTAPEPPPAEELLADARLAPLGPLPPPRHTAGSVLLVGATGFIGAHVLAELLASTDRRVVCLVRAADAAARDRVVAALADAYADARATGLPPRVTVLAGDLRKPRLGLSADTWRDLCADVEAIIDAGGQVDTLRPYPALRATNVDGTRRLVELAATRVRKRLVSLSTTTVRGRPAVALPEDFLAPDTGAPADGYSQSKWVAEQLLRSAERQGVPVTVVRLGEVAAHSGTGVANPRSLPTMVLRLCLRLGARFPTRARVDWTPVDVVARMVTACALPGVTHGAVLNAVAREPVEMADLMGRLRVRGVGLPEIPYEQFLDLATAEMADDEVARCVAVLRTCGADGGDPLAGVVHDAGVGAHTARASRLARALGLHWDGHDRHAQTARMLRRLTDAPVPGRTHPDPGSLPAEEAS